MKPSEVYLRAAKLIESGEEAYSCCAIWNIDPLPSLADNYINRMAPVGKEKWAFWLRESHSGVPDADHKAWRVLALLFMHQIAKESE